MPHVNVGTAGQRQVDAGRDFGKPRVDFGTKLTRPIGNDREQEVLVLGQPDANFTVDQRQRKVDELPAFPTDGQLRCRASVR